MLSIIIPTLNEEKYLPDLLESLKKQDFSDYEVIVADAGSEDETVKMANAYGCRIIKGGLPAKGRNSGAKVAIGEVFLFLDADTVLSEKFLSNSLTEFADRNLGIASFQLSPFPRRKITSFFVDFFYNKMIIFFEKVLPHSATGIIVRKDVFEKIAGFDEDIKLSEDHDLARRAVKYSKFGIIRSEKLFVSDRRFRKDGWISTGIKYFLCELYITFLGPVKSDIFKYRFNHYKDKK